MSLKSNNKIETNKYELEVAVDGAAFEAAVEKAYLKNRKNIRLQGFKGFTGQSIPSYADKYNTLS